MIAPKSQHLTAILLHSGPRVLLSQCMFRLIVGRLLDRLRGDSEKGIPRFTKIKID